MKKNITLLMLVFAITASAQTLNVRQGNVIYAFPSFLTDEMTFADGTCLTIMDKTFQLSEVDEMYIDDSEVEFNAVTVTYDGTSATVIIAGNIAPYITATVSGAHVNVIQSSEVSADNIGEVTYALSGTSTNGEFYMEGTYKATIELRGLTLTNPTGPALNVQNGKRININMCEGTENTIKDGVNGDWKAALRCKGHTEFCGHGILNVYGQTAHAIWSKEYVEVKNCTINILKSVADGINANQYFLMESGVLFISGVGDDGIQISLETEDDGTVTADEDNTGAFTMHGGKITVNTSAEGAKGVKSAGIMTIDETLGTSLVTITSSGGVLVEANDSTSSACLKSDSIMYIQGGTLVLTNTGQGGRALVSEKEMHLDGGVITARAEGENFGESGNGGNPWGGGFMVPMYAPGGGGPGGGGGGPGGGGGQQNNSNSKGAKAIKANGALIIAGGTVSAYSANHEGMESKSTITISGGEVSVEASDDAINSSGDFTITGGYVMGYSTGNDGMDANGNFYINGGTVYAISARSPEVAIDANTEQQKKLYIRGGTIVAIGGLESGSSLSQACKYTSSYTQGSWYALYSGNTQALAFKIPSSSNMGSSLVVSTSGTASLKKGVSVSGGTSIFGGYGNMGATTSGGTTVSLSAYSR